MLKLKHLHEYTSIVHAVLAYQLLFKRKVTLFHAISTVSCPLCS